MADQATQFAEAFLQKQTKETLEALQNLPHPKTPFDVFTDKYPKTMALPLYVMKLMEGAKAQGKDVSTEMAGMLLMALSGAASNILPLPLEVVAPMLLATGKPLTPKDVLDLFKLMAPHTITAAFDGHNQLRNKKEQPKVKSSQWALPSTVEWDKLSTYLEQDAVKAKATIPLPKPLDMEKLPGLFQGSWESPEYDDKHRAQSVVMGEVFTRLMFNYSVGLADECLQQVPGEADDLFTVVLPDTSRIVRLDDFCAALGTVAPDGKLDTYVKKAAALFGFSLSLKAAPEAPPIEVPFTMFMRTGVCSPVKGAEVEAIVPLIHTGLYAKFRSESLNFDLEFYLGSGGNAKFRPELGIRLSWNAPSLEDHMEGDDAIKSILASALYGNVIDSYAFKNKLFKGGYGTNGVCSDSVAPIQQVMKGRCTIYPIIGLTANRIGIGRAIGDTFVAIGHKISDAPAAAGASDAAASSNSASGDSGMVYKAIDLAILQELVQAVTSLPNDNALSLRDYVPTIERIIASIPWPEGKEPFLSSSLARGILQLEAKRQRTAIKVSGRGLNLIPEKEEAKSD